MSAYREGPVAAGLPLPRKRLGLSVAMVVLLAVPAPGYIAARIAAAGGASCLHERGVGMFVLLFLAIGSAAAVAIIGAGAARGRRLPAAYVAAAPVPTAIGGALFFAMGARQALAAVSGFVSPDMTMRVVTVGVAQADGSLVLGCFAGACLAGAAAAALLGSVANVDRARAASSCDGIGPGSMIPSIVAGVIGMVAVIGARLVTRSVMGTGIVAIPGIAVLAAMSAIAARRVPIVRAWHDRDEARAWVSALAAGAVLAAVALVLADLSSRFAIEREGLGAIASAILDPAQKVVVLAGTKREVEGATLVACVDGLAAFAVVAVVVLVASRRSAAGRMTSPVSAPSVVAAVAALACVGAIGFLRMTTGRGVHAAATSAKRDSPGIELPIAAVIPELLRGSMSGPTVSVASNDLVTQDRDLMTRDRTVVVIADRRAKWRAVDDALHMALGVHAPSFPILQNTSGRPSPLPSVSIVVALQARDLSKLGAYADYLAGLDTQSIQLELDPRLKLQDRQPRILKPAPTDDVATVVDAVVAGILADPQSTLTPLLESTSGTPW